LCRGVVIRIKHSFNNKHTIDIVVNGTGFLEYGIAHSNVEDISLMRTIPNMRIITPTDNIMGAMAADYALINETPAYIRFDKYCEGEIYTGRKIDFHRGFETLRDGNDITVITCGSFVSRILRLADEWEANGINARIIDLYSLPVDENAFISSMGNAPVITVEEHILPGGIGSMALELFHKHGLHNPFQRIGIDFVGAYPQTSGSRNYYLDRYGLSDEKITDAVKSLL